MATEGPRSFSGAGLGDGDRLDAAIPGWRSGHGDGDGKEQVAT